MWKCGRGYGRGRRIYILYCTRSMPYCARARASAIYIAIARRISVAKALALALYMYTFPSAFPLLRLVRSVKINSHEKTSISQGSYQKYTQNNFMENETPEDW